MGQEESVPHQEPHSARNYHIPRENIRKQKIQHQGILKLRSTPFPDCVQIDNDGSPLFLQNAQMTLSSLVQSRLYTNRLFPCEDMEKLIENITYTLAYLFEMDVAYKDLSSHNIYYTNGQFKLLPNDLIEGSLYARAYDNFYSKKGCERTEEEDELTCLSPELIIALRMNQRHIEDAEILHKSNVFLFGLVLLEATTLMPSTECFDLSTYDIFNSVITERLELVEEHYTENIARIIANMIDYDYSERMNPKELAIWINRELSHSPSRIESENQYGKRSLKKSKIFGQSKIKKSNLVAHQQDFEGEALSEEEIINKEENQVQIKQSVKRSYSRNNMIYMHGYEDGGIQSETSNSYQDLKDKNGPRNSIYLKHPPEEEQEPQKHDPYQDKEFKKPTQHPYRQDQTRKTYNPEYQRRTYYEPNHYTFDRSYPEANNDQSYGRLNHHNQYRQQHSQVRPAKRARVYNQEPGQHHYQRPVQREYENPISKQDQDLIRSNEGSFKEVNKFRDIGNIGGNYGNYVHQKAKGRSEQALHHKSYDEFDQHQGVTAKGHRHQNKYFPSIDDIENQQQSATKRLAKHSEIKSKAAMNNKEGFESMQSKSSEKSSMCMNDGSINRIRMEVEKSRKMIEEFRKSEGLSN